MDKKQTIKDLKKYYIKPSSELLVIITSQSRSGMSRRMKVLTKDFQDISYDVAKAIGYTWNDKGILVQGCGMDMTFSLMLSLTYAIYGDKQPKGLMGNGGNCIKWTATY